MFLQSQDDISTRTILQQQPDRHSQSSSELLRNLIYAKCRRPKSLAAIAVPKHLAYVHIFLVKVR